MKFKSFTKGFFFLAGNNFMQNANTQTYFALQVVLKTFLKKYYFLVGEKTGALPALILFKPFSFSPSFEASLIYEYCFS